MTSEPESTEPTEPTPTPAEHTGPPSAEATPAPQRHRLHPAATLIEALRMARASLLPLLVVTFGQGLLIGLAVTAAFLLIGGAIAFISWRTETYFVADGSLHHQTGLVRRREQVVPASRISALDTQRGVVQRIFGIVAVHVQTAGGGSKAEMVLGALSFADAEQLRQDLGHRAATPLATPTAATATRTAAATQVEVDPTGALPPAASTDRAASNAPTFYSTSVVPEAAPVVFEMSVRELLIAALTSPSIAVVGAAGAGVASLAQDALPDSVATELADRAATLSVMAILLYTIVAIVGAAVVSVVGTALLYGGFRVTRDEDRLRVRRGILTERIGTVPLSRVHGVRVIESPVRQLLGYASIEVEVAGYAGQDEVTRTIVPLVRRAELAATIARILPAYVWPNAPLHEIPARARRRYLTLPLCLAAIPAIALALAPIGPARLLAVVPPALAWMLGRRSARDAGWLRTDGFLTLRWRTFARHTVVAPEHRLQRASIAVNPLQRRAALATFGVRLSSTRQAGVKHIDADVAHGLLGAALTHRTQR